MPNLNPGTATSRDNTQWVGGRLSGLRDTVGKRWSWAEIDESLWSASWPYQFAVLEAQDDNSYIQRDVYTLPINPESLTNAMPFATVLQATFGGVVENNGGVPLRSISLTGNLGVINDRDVGEALGGLLFQLGGIAGGTIEAAQNLRSAVSTGLGQSFTDNLYPDAVPAVSSGVPERSTGYYQWLFLQRFMESYAEAKKTEEGERLRLALYIWKEQAAYLISPEVLQLTRSADKPVEYQYQFRATAYARIDPRLIYSLAARGRSGMRAPAPDLRMHGSKSKLAECSRMLEAARKVVKKSSALASAINSDFEKTVGGPVRQTGLLLKDAVGTAKTWADFPESIKNTAYRIKNENSPIFRSLVDGAPSKAPSSSGKLVSLTVDTSVMDDEQVDSLGNPTPELLIAMEKETERVRAFTTRDFQTMRTKVEETLSLYSAKVGLGDPRSTSTVQPIRQATDDDFRFMAAMSDISLVLSQVAVIQKQAPETSLLDYVAGMASVADIDFRRALSKFAVPFPYGSTLEQLALQYLGDAERWGEIAALNELREPYVDEVGQNQLFLANGNGNDFVVADGSLIEVDHFVTIASQTQLAERRRVMAVKQLAPGYWRITLGGAADLGRFRLHERAYVHFFLPGTVNSGKVIFIPSTDETTNDDLRLRFVPALSDLEQILQVGGVDGMLTPTGDIAITKDGDWPYVKGLAALIQWARVALNTRLGSWLLFPGFGVDVGVGQSLADFSPQDLLTSIKTSFRMNNAFTGVNSALITTEGPATSVTLELGVRGVDVTLPVTFPLAQ